MENCSYNANERKIAQRKSCQFGNEELIKIKDANFCQYHLPWSLEDLSQRFGVVISEGSSDRKKLKDHWDGSRANSLHERILKRLLSEGDLTGTTLPGDLNLAQTVANIVIADGFFPKPVKIDQRVNKLEFRNCKFCDTVEFRGGASLSFDVTKSIFVEELTITGGLRSGRFDEAVFHKRANLQAVTFQKEVSFKKCQFLGPSRFDNCNFQEAEVVSFDGSVFVGPASFRAGSHPALNRIFFRDVVFKHDVGFEGRRFQSSLIFRGAKFFRAPRFQDAEISFESVFPKLKDFCDWKTIPDGIRSKSISVQREYYENAAQAYRTLRYAMKAQDAYEEESLFWELEMRAKARALAWDRAGWLPKLFSSLYALTSRYGNSLDRPILLWLLLLAIFATIYSTFRFDGGLNIVAGVGLSEFSFQQTIRPFGVWTDEGARTISRLVLNADGVGTQVQTLAVRLLATIQSVVSLTCIALFGFALRRRFRMT